MYNREVKKILVILSVLILILSLFVVTFNYISADDATQEQKDAIIEAERWLKYDKFGFCVQVITPAVHTDTRAEYEFRDSCLPPGWKPLVN
jgi:hypothetical protein